MGFRKCHSCGRIAMVRIEGGGLEECLECHRRSGEGSPVHVCSVERCRNEPVYMAVLAGEPTRSVLLCEAHYGLLRKQLKCYLVLPRWLTRDDDIRLDEDGATIELDLDDC